jgi:hypothetical protein
MLSLMARYERDPRPAAGGTPTPDGRPVVKMQLDPSGRWKPVAEPEEKTPVTEAKPQPPQADDPRPASWRNVPPYAAG